MGIIMVSIKIKTKVEARAITRNYHNAIKSHFRVAFDF